MKLNSLVKLFAVSSISAISALVSTQSLANNKDFTLAYDSDNQSKMPSDLQEIIDEFNSKNKTKLKLVKYNKNAPATLNLFVNDKFGSENDILLNSKKFISVSKMAELAKVKIDTTKLSKNPIFKTAELADAKGNMIAYPLFISTAVMFYDKNAFRRAGLDEDNPPKTWSEMQNVLSKLSQNGSSCPYTSSVPVFIHLDNVTALAGQNTINHSSKNLHFNGLSQMRHIAKMTTWHQAGYFKTFGKDYQASEKFADGTCAIITTDSWEFNNFYDIKGRNLGVAMLPKHEEERHAQHPHTLINGGYIWAGAGYSNNDYQNAVKFLNFLAEKDSQEQLLEHNFFIPLNKDTSLDSEEKDALKVMEASINAKNNGAANNYSTLRAYKDVEEIAYKELQNIWNGKKPAKVGLDDAVKHGNAAMNKKANLKKHPF